MKSVEDFMKESGIQSQKITDEIQNLIHNDCVEDFEFRSFKFIKTSDPKEFSKAITLENSEINHSWAGKKVNTDTATLLYGDETLRFGESYSYEFYANGNQTCDEHSLTEPEFNINATYVVLILNKYYDHINDRHYDEICYTCVAYIGGK